MDEPTAESKALESSIGSLQYRLNTEFSVGKCTGKEGLNGRRKLQTELEAKYHRLAALQLLEYVNDVKKTALATGLVEFLEAPQEKGTCALCHEDIPTTYQLSASGKGLFQRSWCCGAVKCWNCTKARNEWVKKVGKESEELSQIDSNGGRVDHFRWQEVENAMCSASKCPFCRAEAEHDHETFASHLPHHAEAGKSWAQLELGKLMMKGQHGMRKDRWGAAEWLQKAADNGNVVAMTLLAEMWGKGFPEKGMPSCNEKKKAYYHQAARQGYFLAQYRYAELLGLDSKDSVLWLDLSAAQGFGMAQYWLGMRHQGKNSFKAVYWLKLAALQGEPNAQMAMVRNVIQAKMCSFDSQFGLVGHSAIPEACFWFELAKSFAGVFFRNAPRPEQIQLNRCGCCGQPQHKGLRLKACKACKGIVYCGTECQKAHWKMGHKVDCAVVKECRKELELEQAGQVSRYKPHAETTTLPNTPTRPS